MIETAGIQSAAGKKREPYKATVPLEFDGGDRSCPCSRATIENHLHQRRQTRAVHPILQRGNLAGIWERELAHARNFVFTRRSNISSKAASSKAAAWKMRGDSR